MTRYSTKDSQDILVRLNSHPFEDLHALFREGTAPFFEEIRGKTAGSFLSWNPGNSWWLAFFINFQFSSPLARWTGKEFLLPFNKDKKGEGINLFRNRLCPRRYRFDTYIDNCRLHRGSCLILDYRAYLSPMLGLVDDVRKIEPGVFLGQMHYKFPLKKEPWFVGYFVLCALRDHG